MPLPDQIERVNVSSTGDQTDQNVFGLGIEDATFSDDGRYVVFNTTASNLVEGDTNELGDIFIRDLFNGTTELISVSSSGEQADRGGGFATISDDGRYVVFSSAARNLVEEDVDFGQFGAGVFVRDLAAGTTELVSVSTAGEGARGALTSQSISADSRYVLFESSSSHLVEGDTNGASDLFVRDLTTNTTERVNVSSAGEQANVTIFTDDFYAATISDDGRYVLFYSEATNLVEGDTNFVQGNTARGRDLFIHDRTFETTERVNVSSTGEQANDASLGLTISADGRYVLFFSKATNLVEGDTNGRIDLFIRDLTTNTTERVNVSSTGEQDSSGIIRRFSDATISDDGRYVFFTSGSNLVEDDTNGEYDVFVRDLINGTTERVSLSSTGEQGNSGSYYHDISSDGRYVVFTSWASNLVEGDTNELGDIFIRDLVNGITERVSISSTGEQGIYGSYRYPGEISDDGRYVFFASGSPNLVEGDTNGDADLFVTPNPLWVEPNTGYSIAGSTSVVEGNVTVSFVVTRTDTTAAETLYASTVNTPEFGYATNSGDYARTVLNQEVVFAAGEATATIDVFLVDDDDAESDETFGLIVQADPNDPPNVSLASFDWTITDNETEQTTYRITGPAVVSESAVTAFFTIQRFGELSEDTLYASTLNGAALGYARNVGDYGPSVSDLAVPFAADQEFATVEVDILNDAVPESTEEFGLIIQRDAGLPADDFLSRFDWSIQDDDARSVTYSIEGPSSVAEDAGEVTFTITRSGRFEQDTVYLKPISGSDLGLSENAGDFVAPPQAIAVAFAEGQRSETFSVSISDDLVEETRESFGVVVLDQSGDDPGAALARRDWVIVDNDAPIPAEPPASDLALPFIVELVHLAESSYSPNSTLSAEAAGWTPVLIPGLGTSISSIDTFNLLESNVHFYEALVDGDRTLAVAFSGTQPDVFGVTDLITQIGNWDNLYASHSGAIESVLNWADNAPNDDPFDNLVVTGHSMGGILTEFMLADEGLSDFTLMDDATGVTFGSPGSPDKSLTDRIINFTTLGDPVAMLHAGDFFGIEPKAEDAAKLSQSTLSYALAAVDGVDAVVKEVGDTAAEELSGDLLESFDQRPSREGINVTMLRTADNVFDIAGSTGFHGLSGPAGYLNSIGQLADFYGSASRTGSEDLDFWLSGRDGWHYLREPDTLDLAVSVFQGFGFGALNLALDSVRLVVGVSNAVTNTLQAITGAAVQMVEIGVDGIAKAWGSLTNFVSGTIDVIGTTFDNIGSTIEVGFNDLFFGADDADFESGSAIIRVDTDGDGVPDLETTLEGDYDLERFVVVTTEAGTSVFYSEQPQLVSTELADILVGGTEDETAWGAGGNDALFGMSGSDTLFGNEGRDTLDGGLGDDHLNGGPGNDMTIGGIGRDTFVHEGGHDIIGDFAPLDETLIVQIAGLTQGDVETAVAAATDTVEGALVDFGVSSVLFQGLSATELVGIDAQSNFLPGIDLDLTLSDRAGVPLEGAVITFTPDDGSAALNMTTTNASGSYTLNLSADAEGRIEGSRDYNPLTDPNIGVSDALNALRLAVGLAPSFGEPQALDFIAADVNRDGSVSVGDALDILRFAVGLTTPNSPEWIFLDEGQDLSGVSSNSVDYDTGMDIGLLTAGANMEMTGVLLGSVQDYV
jgi:hypothetical protein